MGKGQVLSYCFELETYTDYRGSLTVAQERLDITFLVRRVFWLYGGNDFRGRHSHKKCTMILVCVHGSVIVNVDKSQYLLDSPNLALYLEPEAWREIEMNDDSVVIALCSELFDEDDYVRPIR